MVPFFFFFSDMCSSTDDLTLNYGLHSPQDLMLFFFLLRHDSPNKLLLVLRWMSFPGTHREWFNRVHTTVSLEERYQKTPLRPRLPHRLWRGHLSSVNSPGRHCQRRECLECGLMVSGPVSQACIPSRAGQQRPPGPALTSVGFSLEQEFLPQELWLWPPGRPVGDHPRPNISALTLSKCAHILVCNIILSIFCDITLTSAARNVCQSTNLSHPAQRKAGCYSVSLECERFVFWEGDAWEVCVCVCLPALMSSGTVRFGAKCFWWTEEHVTAAPC